MGSFYLKSGSTFTVTSEEALDLHRKLPVGTYTIKFNNFTGQFFLEQIDNFKPIAKLYGDTKSITKRIMRTFDSRPNMTGVLLAGEKGSGKTLQAKDISLEGHKRGIPTIVVNSAFSGDAFNTFMQSIDQPVIVIFDEFEKVYEPESQQALLTLFDGIYPSKKLFIITCNESYRINKQMINRPGRIYYRIDYMGLEHDFIREYAEDNLNDKTQVESMIRICSVFDTFNFDMLKALVEEMNIHAETPQNALKWLNAKPQFSGSSRYDVHLQYAGKEVPEDRLYTDSWGNHPLLGEIEIEHRTPDDDEGEYTESKFESGDFISLENNGTRFIFKNKFGTILTLDKHTPKMYHYTDAF